MFSLGRFVYRLSTQISWKEGKGFLFRATSEASQNFIRSRGSSRAATAPNAVVHVDGEIRNRIGVDFVQAAVTD